MNMMTAVKRAREVHRSKSSFPVVLTAEYVSPSHRDQNHQFLPLDRQKRPPCLFLVIDMFVYAWVITFTVQWAFLTVLKAADSWVHLCSGDGSVKLVLAHFVLESDLLFSIKTQMIKQSKWLRTWWTQQIQLLLLYPLLIIHISILYWHESISFKQVWDREAVELSK